MLKTKRDSRKMTKDKGLRSMSPIHVHVDDTPVHVHVKKGKKKNALAKSASNQRLQRSTASSRARARSVSPTSKSGPWVHAPGKATKNSRITWQGPTNKLEVNHLHGDDLSTDEEEQASGEVRRYEHKINTLMDEVGTLKNEVVLQKALKEIEHKEDLLNTSSRVIEKQEVELQNVEDELAVTETENKLLRKNMELFQEEVEISKCSHKNMNLELDEGTNAFNDNLNDNLDEIRSCDKVLKTFDENADAEEFRSQKDLLNYEREKLMKKLIEAEMDGQAASLQVRDLKDMLRRLKDERSLSSAEQARFAKQREQFLDSMADFEASNRTLRRLLRDHHRIEASSLRLSEQRDVLLRKVADGDMASERLRNQLLECESLIADLRNQLRIEKEERLALGNLQGSLENTRGHLQKQLRTKEGDCNRMAVQIRTLEGQLAQERIEKDHLHDLAHSSKDRVDRDKDALKKAARAQKVRAEKAEEDVSRLTKQLSDLELKMSDLTSRAAAASAKADLLNHEKEMSTADREAKRTRVAELEALVDRVEENAKAQNESLTQRLHEKMTESTTLRLENERLKNSLSGFEARMKQSDEDMNQLRDTVKQYEKLIDEYKEQASRIRNEADESFAKVEEHAREKDRIQRDGELELEKVKQRLHQRLQELEPLPELLRATELRLHEANEKLLNYEHRNTENTKIIAEMTAKLEHHSEALDQAKHKCIDSQDVSRSLQSRYEGMERRLKDVEEQNLHLQTEQAKSHETIHQESLRLEEKARENASLTRQLENALSDNRRQQEQARDRFSSKERTYQGRIVDLETQLSQLRADQAKVKREKEENERKFNSRLYDLKDRLEQCHSTNRSMQNYVQFLKNSYANVFGDTAASFTSPPSPAKPYP